MRDPTSFEPYTQLHRKAIAAGITFELRRTGVCFDGRNAFLYVEDHGVHGNPRTRRVVRVPPEDASLNGCEAERSALEGKPLATHLVPFGIGYPWLDGNEPYPVDVRRKL
ncbi:MAG: hypothetical protein HY341_02370 [Candidatus Kerfeldbacteria bacterium]|nr:hypothetical protein [Candidatus Kerfeldbacteria bacterium]